MPVLNLSTCKIPGVQFSYNLKKKYVHQFSQSAFERCIADVTVIVSNAVE